MMTIASGCFQQGVEHRVGVPLIGDQITASQANSVTDPMLVADRTQSYTCGTGVRLCGPATLKLDPTRFPCGGEGGRSSVARVSNPRRETWRRVRPNAAVFKYPSGGTWPLPALLAQRTRPVTSRVTISTDRRPRRHHLDVINCPRV